MKMLRPGLVLLFTFSFIGMGIGMGPASSWSQAQERRLDARLTDLSMWVGPQDALNANIAIRNSGSEPVRDLQVALSIYPGIATRSHLERSFTGRLGEPVFSDTISVDLGLEGGGAVDPRSSRNITFSKSISEIGFFRTAEDRVYPMTLTVKSGRLAAPPIQTQLIYFTKPASIPLSVALVVASNPDPIYNSNGQVTEFGVSRLAGEGSAANVLLSALEAHPDARLTLAPSGLTLDSLADLANGYILATGATRTRGVEADSEGAQQAQRILERLRVVGSRESIRFVLTPYSRPSLPWLRNEGFIERIGGQLRQTERALTLHAGVRPLGGWASLADGVVDDAVVGDFSRGDQAASLLLSPSSIRGPSRRQLTLSAPVALGGRQSQITALVYDQTLSTRVTPTDDVGVVETRQRFLAESATIMLERPGQKRVIAVQTPRDWVPHSKFLSDVLFALVNSPWMRGVTLDEALTAAPATESASAVSTDAALDQLPLLPEDNYVTELRAASRAINDYRDLHPPEARLARLERMLAISESSIWWDTRRETARGLEFARAVGRDVQREFSKIRGPRPQTITLTSRTGVIPLVVTNSTGYPVRVVVRLESDNLEFSGGDVIHQELAPPAQTFDVTARTTSSGTFPLRVVVETPDRAIEVDATNLTVRSTVYNLVGVAITTGAGIFLVGWWAIGTARRRISS